MFAIRAAAAGFGPGPVSAPWQSRKFAAAVQAATCSRNPVLLLIRTNENHGVTAFFGQRVGNAAPTLPFFAREPGPDEAMERVQ
jgi:prolyl oligopeptidase